MKCPSCSAENKENATHCKKCGTSLAVQLLWSPTWEWHAKTLGIIYACLILIFFVLNRWLLKPYLRDIPPEVTPWLAKSLNIHK